jgi:hypothetical protein
MDIKISIYLEGSIKKGHEDAILRIVEKRCLGSTLGKEFYAEFHDKEWVINS